MQLKKTKLSLGGLLTLLETREPESIQVNHLVIEDNSEALLANVPLHQLPSFTVVFPGFIEVEMFMDNLHHRVQRLILQQTAMRFDELEANGDILPGMTIACGVLNSSERARLDAVARGYIKKGKLLDASRGEALLTQYVSKSMFSPSNYLGLSSNVTQ